MLNEIIDFIFPRTSVISDDRLPENNSNNYISDDELLSLATITEKDREDLSFKIDSGFTFSHFAFYEGDDLSKIIYQLKYGGMKKLGIYLGELLGNELKNYGSENNLPPFDLIVPVPLFKTKLRERGYNQCDLICKGMSKVLGIKFINDLLIRERHTVTQTRLSREDRIENVKDAFVFNEACLDIIGNKKVIIVDDVITTGSTINEALRIVRMNCCNSVMACSLAMARD